MLPDFKIISHIFEDRPDIEIWPVFDLHCGAAEHEEERWDSFRRMILAKDNAYILLGGDLINNATKSGVSDIFLEKYPPSTQVKIVTEMLRPFAEKQRIICSLGGNHERRSEKDANYSPGYDIMCKLDCEHLYRESMAFIRIKMGVDGGAGQRNPCYIIAAAHGAAGGAKVGGVANRAVDFASNLDGADIVVVGHSHKPFVTPPAKIVIDPQHGMASIRPYYVINATAWMGYGGYAAQKMLPPASIAPQVIRLYGKKKKIEVTM